MHEAMIEALLAGLASPDPGARDRAADEVTDVHRGLRAAEVSSLAGALVSTLLRETVPSCQEAELHALCDLKAWHELDARTLQPLSVLRSRLQPVHLEYLDDLVPEQPDS
jgi:hypothetical protein